MSKTTSKPLLYNKGVPHELMILTELIVDVHGGFEKLPWSNNSQVEIGFYQKDIITKTTIFFGIWYEAWNSFAIPLCIAIDYKGKAPFEKYQEIKSLIEMKKIQGLIFKDYQGYAMVLIDYDFYNFKNDNDRLVDLFYEISIFLKINHNL